LISVDFSVLAEPSLLDPEQPNWLVVVHGWINSLWAFGGAIALGSAIGLPLGVAAASRHAILRGLATGYTEVFRNIPLLVQIFLWFFVLPEILPQPMGRWLKRDLANPEYWTLLVALGFFLSARVAVLVRVGIEALPKGQAEAAIALGLSRFDRYARILLPQALRLVSPPLTTEFSGCFKATSVGLTIGYIELTQSTRTIAEQTFRTVEVFVVATAVYAMSILTIILAMQGVEHALRRPKRSGGR
jgi:glutamate/aspartate transport system permease protein